MTPTEVLQSGILAGYDPLAPYISMPGASSWTAASQLLALGSKPAAQAFALENFRSFASVSRGAVASVATSVGVPDWLVDPMTTFFTQIPLVRDGKTLAEGLVAGITAQVDGALAECATAVPIVGAIVKIGLSIWHLVAQQIQDGKPEGRAPQSAVLYNIDEDTAQGNLLRAFAQDPDWTVLFMPPSADPAFRLYDVGDVPGVGNRWGGMEWTPAKSEGGLGLIPGIAEQVGLYQLSKGRPGTDAQNYPPIVEPITTSGVLLPSGRKFAAMLWQQCMKPSVSMFSIDTHKIQDAWRGWYENLWNLSNSPGIDQRIMWGIRKSASYARLDPCPGYAPKKNQIGNDAAWCKGVIDPTFAPVSTVGAFSVGKLQKKLGKGLSYRYSDIVDYVCAIHRDRAYAACRTLTVAYVAPDAPLLKADPVLKGYYDSMRELLLHHPARYRVELDLVPDEAYRSALWHSRILAEGIGFGARAPASQAGKNGKAPDLPPPPGSKPPKDDPAPPQGLPDGLDQAAGTGSGTGWVAAGLALAVVGGAIVVQRVRR
jgi:hypothetical protein